MQIKQHTEIYTIKVYVRKKKKINKASNSRNQKFKKKLEIKSKQNTIIAEGNKEQKLIN